MNAEVRHSILLVEDSSSDALLLRETFVDGLYGSFAITHVARLAEAIRCLSEQHFDIVLLDLGLEDSQGIDTFVALHKHAPEVPVVVLTGLDNDSVRQGSINLGAQDYLVKQRLHEQLLPHAVRFAIDRHRAQADLRINERRTEQTREIESVERLAVPPATTVTAQLYSGGSLRSVAAEQFDRFADQYSRLLDSAVEQRIFKVERAVDGALHEFANRLGGMRAGPRDVIEMHVAVLQRKLKKLSPNKTQLYVEEARLAVLELMGYLTTYYRQGHTQTMRRE